MSLFTIFAFVGFGFEFSKGNEVYTATSNGFFFEIIRLPPQDVQHIPRTVRLIMILSKSNNAITGTKMLMQKKLVK